MQTQGSESASPATGKNPYGSKIPAYEATKV